MYFSVNATVKSFSAFVIYIDVVSVSVLQTTSTFVQYKNISIQRIPDAFVTPHTHFCIRVFEKKKLADALVYVCSI